MFYTLHRSIELKTDISSAWKFFSNPHNLPIITPPWLGLTIQSETGDSIHEGQIIRYKVKVLPKLSMTWLTEITHIKEPYYFVDEQRYGPYKMWHHQHILREAKNHIICEDIVNYIMPFGILGSFVHKLHVANQIDKIFNYRTEVLNLKFNVNE